MKLLITNIADKSTCEIEPTTIHFAEITAPSSSRVGRRFIYLHDPKCEHLQGTDGWVRLSGGGENATKVLEFLTNQTDVPRVEFCNFYDDAPNDPSDIGVEIVADGDTTGKSFTRIGDYFGFKYEWGAEVDYEPGDSLDDVISEYASRDAGCVGFCEKRDGKWVYTQ